MRDLIILGLREFLRTVGQQSVDAQRGIEIWQVRNLIRLTEYRAARNARPSSGDPLAIAWSVWIRIGAKYWGWGSVRTWARNDDLEIWICGKGPYTTVDDSMEIHPPICATALSLKTIRIRNAAPNEREAAGCVCLMFPVGPHYDFLPLPAGNTTLASTPDPLPDQTLVSSFRLMLKPIGAPRIEKLYGVPEWLGGSQ